MSKTGAHLIASVGQHSRYLDADGSKVVGNRRGTNPPASQNWAITQVPVSTDPKNPRDNKYERFTIYNPYYNQYLDYDSANAILTDVQTKWEIQNVNDNHYKIVVDNGGRACSLNSDADDAPVTVKNFLGPNEEWILKPFVDPTPAPPPIGIRGILSAAFDDTAIAENGWDHLHAESPYTCVEAFYISAEADGYTLRLNASDSTYLAVVNDVLWVSESKFIWTITPVNGHYKIGYSSPEWLYISIPDPRVDHSLELSPYKGVHQEWFFKEFPLKVAQEGEAVKVCPVRQDKA